MPMTVRSQGHRGPFDLFARKNLNCHIYVNLFGFSVFIKLLLLFCSAFVDSN